MAQHFLGIARRLPVPRIVVLVQAPDNVPEFMEQRGDLRGHAVSLKRCYPQHMHASWLQRPCLAVLLQDGGGSFEKRTIRVQTNRGIAARVLQGTGDVRMFENLRVPNFLHGKDVARSVFLQREIHRSKRGGRIRIGFAKPLRTAIFGLENFQNLVPGSRNCFSLLAEGQQLLLNSLLFASHSGRLFANLSAGIIRESVDVTQLLGLRPELASLSKILKIFTGGVL